MSDSKSVQDKLLKIKDKFTKILTKNGLTYAEAITSLTTTLAEIVGNMALENSAVRVEQEIYETMFEQIATVLQIQVKITGDQMIAKVVNRYGAKIDTLRKV